MQNLWLTPICCAWHLNHISQSKRQLPAGEKSTNISITPCHAQDFLYSNGGMGHLPGRHCLPKYKGNDLVREQPEARCPRAHVAL